MSRAPLFSIVTVTLNCADAAIDTARSVLAQEFNNYEYIVKDGGSTDGTIEQLQNLGVKVFTNKDRGVYDAMNQALSHCTGEYVCFLNSGDFFPDKSTLAAVANHIRQTKEPDIVYGDIRSLSRHPYFREQDHPVHGRTITYPARLKRFYLFRKVICHQSWFVKRDIYGGNPFDLRYQLLADYAILLDLILIRKASYSHIPYVTVIFDGSGVTGSVSPLLKKERCSVLRKYYNRMEVRLYQAVFDIMQLVNRRLVNSLLPGELREKLSRI